MAATGEATTLSVPPGAKTTRDASEGERHRLLLNLAEETNDRIEQLALALGHGEKGKVIDQAIGLLYFAFESARDGKRLWIVDEQGQPDTQIDIPV